MNDVNSYLILNRKTNFITNLFISISIIFLLLFLLISQVKYQKYYQTIGQVVKEQDTYQLALYLYPYQLEIIKNNNTLTIENSEYTYNINHISNEYIISSDYQNYLKVVLDIKLKPKDKIENNIFQIKMLESNKKIFYYLKDYFKKGSTK